MSIVAWIVLGLVGGLAAGWLVGYRGRDLAAAAVVSLLGAVSGGFLAAVLLGLDVAGLDLSSVFVAALGAALLFLFLRAIPPSTEVFD